MIVYNLTDQAGFGKKPSPHVITINGQAIEPGKKADIERIKLARVSGMVYSGRISLGTRPKWYMEARARQQEARLEELRAKKAAAEAKVEAEEETKSPPKKKRSKKKGKK